MLRAASSAQHKLLRVGNPSRHGLFVLRHSALPRQRQRRSAGAPATAESRLLKPPRPPSHPERSTRIPARRRAAVNHGCESRSGELRAAAGTLLVTLGNPGAQLSCIALPPSSGAFDSSFEVRFFACNPDPVTLRAQTCRALRLRAHLLSMRNSKRFFVEEAPQAENAA